MQMPEYNNELDTKVEQDIIDTPASTNSKEESGRYVKSMDSDKQHEPKSYPKTKPIKVEDVMTNLDELILNVNTYISSIRKQNSFRLLQNTYVTNHHLLANYVRNDPKSTDYDFSLSIPDKCLFKRYLILLQVHLQYIKNYLMKISSKALVDSNLNKNLATINETIKIIEGDIS